MAGSDAEALPSEIVSTSRTRPEAGAAEAARVPRPGSLAARRAAQAEYYALDGSVIPSSPPGIVLVDHHDLVPGQREECAFVVRGASRGLLEAVNEFIATTAFPVAGELGKRDG